MTLRDLCDDLVESVDGAIGCALIDLGTGLLLATSDTGDAPEAGAMDMLAATGTEFFRGGVERQLRSVMGDAESRDSFVQEVQTTTEESYHFMCVVPGKEQTVLMLVTDRTANLGLGWVAMRGILERVRAATATSATGLARSIMPLRAGG